MSSARVNGLDAPISTIKLRIGASEYEPRWSFLAEYLLSNRGLTLKDVLEGSNGPRSSALMMELLSACVAHHFPANATPDAATLAGQVTPEQRLLIWPALMAAGRAAGAIVDKPKNAQAPEPEPTQDQAPKA